MPLLARVSSLWNNIVHRNRVDRALDDELRAYVELLTEEKIAAGHGREAARRAALIEVGGVEQVKAGVRDVRTGAFLDTVVQDLRYAGRTLARSPLFTGAAVLALALGIGANTAILSVVNAVLLRPLPYKEADRLVVILHNGKNPVSPENYFDWQRQNGVFEAMGAAEYWTTNSSGVDRPEKLWALRMTANVLPLLGVQPLLGRVFLASEDVPGKDHEVVLSYGLWQRLFAGDAQIVGRLITLDGETYTIVGVMPRGFQFAPFWATKAELWAPLALGSRTGNRSGNSLRVFARLKPGVTLDQSRAEMAAITARLDREYPGTNRDVKVVSLKEKVVGDIRPALLVLLGAVGFVLLIACANVAHMLLARAAARRREIAVRTALGASRGRIIRQFLTESVVLALMGGGAGVLLALVGIRLLVAASPANIPRVDTIALDARVLAFTLLVSLLTGVIFGLVPAFQASTVGLGESLKEGERGSTEGVRRNRVRSALVASEFALALVLLVGAGLMIRSFIALEHIDPGFDSMNLLTAVASVRGSEDGAPGRKGPFFQEVVRRVKALPGVRSASAINHLPLAGDRWGWSFSIEGRPRPLPGEGPVAVYRVVLPGYFRTMGITLLRGRDITDRDNVGAPSVVIVNERLARQYWPGEDPIGKRITFDDPPKVLSWVTVVGVSHDAKQDDWVAAPDPELYLPYLQSHEYLESTASHFDDLTLVARTAGDPAALVPAVRTLVSSIDRNVPLSEVQTMEGVVIEATAGARFYLFLLAAFASVALILAAVGIYAVMSYSVSRRAHEIGLRLALGAERGDVIRLVVGQGMAGALVGAGVGVVCALGLTRFMGRLLYGVGVMDPATFVAVALVLSGVALAASYIPARRATQIDPLVALRSE